MSANNPEVRDTEESEVTQEELQAYLQKEIPGSSTQDVVTMIFIAVMIIGTVVCSIIFL